MIHLKIIDPINGVSYDNDIQSMEVITTEGHLGLQANLIPTVANLVNGKCYITFKDNTKRDGIFTGGLLYVDKIKGIVILTNFFEWSKEETLVELKNACDRLTKEIQALDKNDPRYAELASELFLDEKRLEAYNNK